MVLSGKASLTGAVTLPEGKTLLDAVEFTTADPADEYPKIAKVLVSSQPQLVDALGHKCVACTALNCDVSPSGDVTLTTATGSVLDLNGHTLSFDGALTLANSMTIADSATTKGSLEGTGSQAELKIPAGATVNMLGATASCKVLNQGAVENGTFKSLFVNQGTVKRSVIDLMDNQSGTGTYDDKTDIGMLVVRTGDEMLAAMKNGRVAGAQLVENVTVANEYGWEIVVQQNPDFTIDLNGGHTLKISRSTVTIPYNLLVKDSNSTVKGNLELIDGATLAVNNLTAEAGVTIDGKVEVNGTLVSGSYTGKVTCKSTGCIRGTASAPVYIALLDNSGYVEDYTYVTVGMMYARSYAQFGAAVSNSAVRGVLIEDRFTFTDEPQSSYAISRDFTIDLNGWGLFTQSTKVSVAAGNTLTLKNDVNYGGDFIADIQLEGTARLP